MKNKRYRELAAILVMITMTVGSITTVAAETDLQQRTKLQQRQKQMRRKQKLQRMQIPRQQKQQIPSPRRLPWK